MRKSSVAVFLLTVACGSSDNTPADDVRAQLASLAPAANLGHRGTGLTRAGHPFPENSISSCQEAIAQGANGIDIDVQMTKDGALIVMHDDTLDRTTDCTGCVSGMTFDEVRGCRLIDGARQPTDERPPTLSEIYAAIGGDALISIELKVSGPDCLTESTGPAQMVPRALDEVSQTGEERRTMLSSFDETAAALIKTEQPGYYCGLLSLESGADLVQTALRLGLDAIHPSYPLLSADTVHSALDQGLQVNVWTVDSADLMQVQIDKGVTTITTNEPGILADLLGR